MEGERMKKIECFTAALILAASNVQGRWHVDMLTSLMNLQVSGHGSLVSPPSWADRWGYMGVKPKRNCDAGWDNVFYGDQSKVGWSCMWYSSNVTIPGNDGKFMVMMGPYLSSD